MRWIGNARGNLGGSSHVAKTGIALLAFVNLSGGLGWGALATGEMLGFGKDSERRMIEFVEKARASSTEETGKPHPAGNADVEPFFLRVRRGTVVFGSLLAFAGMVLGMGLLFVKNWARVTLILIATAWVLIVLSAGFLSPAFSRQGWIIGLFNLAKELALTQWNALAIIAFLLWKPVRQLFQLS